MGELSARNFGLVIAYLLPGFIAVVALSGPVPAVASWLAASPEGQPTVGGFLYVTIASLAAGMFASSLRWLALDSLHHRTGIKPPSWDFSQLQSNLAAYGLLVDFHYRYYQFNANTFIAVALAYLVRLSGGCRWCGGAGWVDFGFVIVEVVLFATSRDTLRKYYARVSQVLAASDSSRKEKCHVERRQPSQSDDSGEYPEAQRDQGDAPEGGEAGRGPERPGGEE
ncbi:MAG: hypothetical protein IT419_17545 [Planctomycetes bacterium]|nr:hypothetical protein [Planctomycetota bacterium]